MDKDYCYCTRDSDGQPGLGYIRFRAKRKQMKGGIFSLYSIRQQVAYTLLQHAVHFFFSFFYGLNLLLRDC